MLTCTYGSKSCSVLSREDLLLGLESLDFLLDFHSTSTLRTSWDFLLDFRTSRTSTEDFQFPSAAGL
jgi:hypothetical protein